MQIDFLYFEYLHCIRIMFYIKLMLFILIAALDQNSIL